MTRQTRSSSRVTARPAEDPSPDGMPSATNGLKSIVAKAAAPRKRASPTAAISTSFQSVKSTKRQKTKGSVPSKPIPTSTASTAQTRPTLQPNKSAYTPTLLPPTLSFSLDEAEHHLTAHDPRFGHFFTNIPPKPFVPPIEAIDPYKTLVTSIIGQQVSWMAARAITKRFKELFGYADEGEGFPSPEEVAREDVLRLKGVGLSTRKAEYVICLAEHFVDGRLSAELLRDGTDEEISKALIAVRGIGQWTVDMFLMFSLRRPDVLPVGDLGVQKGLLRWVLAAHGALPKAKSGKAAEEARKKYGLGKKEEEVVIDRVDADGSGEIDTTVTDSVSRAKTPEQDKGKLPPTPLTPTNMSGPSTHLAALHTPAGTAVPRLPDTPLSPGLQASKTDIKPAEVLETSSKSLPPPAPETFLDPMPDHPAWDVNRIAAIEEGLSLETMKARLNGKKAKGGVYLTPAEMDVLTQGWRPYRSVATYYMWPAGEDF